MIIPRLINYFKTYVIQWVRLQRKTKWKLAQILLPRWLNLWAYIVLLPLLFLSKRFLSIIAKFQISQNKALTHCKSLYSSLNSIFNELKASFSLLLSQIVEQKSENASLRLEFTTLKNKIFSRQTCDTKMPIPNTDQLPQLLQELS